MSIVRILIVIFLQLFVIESRKLDNLIQVKTGVHLFVDNQYLQNTSSLEFQNGVIQKDTDHPIVYPEHPWEIGIHFFTSLLQVPANLSVNGKPMYIIYYVCMENDTSTYAHNVSVCVANSTDGINWEKPLM